MATQRRRRAGEDFQARLRATAAAYVRFATDDAALLELMFAGKHKEHSGTLEDAAERAFSVMLRLIQQGQDDGRARAGRARAPMRDSGAMATWTARTRVAGPPDDVLMLLTEPEAIARWAPIAFDVEDLENERLMAGDHVHVHGRLAGRSLDFEVAVSEADAGHLVLSATGPIRLDVEYLATAVDSGSEVHASITVSGRGLRGRVLAQATDALLASGALRIAVDRIAGQLAPAIAV